MSTLNEMLIGDMRCNVETQYNSISQFLFFKLNIHNLKGTE